ASEAAAALAALAASGPDELPGAPGAPEGVIEPPFVGRGAQLAALEDALARVASSTAVVVHVHGPSGIGKSMLIGRFLDRVAARRDAIVLRGRCHPYEQIAFGGVDRIVDGLAERIRDGELSADDIAPNALAALVRLFPTLPWRVPATAGALADDDRGLRLLGIATLRELLVRAAAARPLVLWIDDVHWIDDDTAEVLAALAGIPNTLAIYSSRTEDAARAAALGTPPGEHGRARVHRIELPLGALDAADLEALVGAVAPGVAADTRRKLAAAAAGSPVLARVLGRHDAHHPWTAELDAAGSPAALWNRMIDALPAAQRALFDAIAVAPGPIAAAIVRRAVRVDHASSELRALEQLGIVCRVPGRGAIRLAPFHDRLRQLRLEHLDAAARAHLHRELARSHELVASDDYEALVHHLHELAEDARAGHYAVLAADRASGNLAFGAAASYYARAIEWLPDRAEPWELHRKLAECEANRGHAESAGAQFELAAATHRRAAGSRLATTRLSLRAAEQLLHCGRIPEGYRLLREVLETLRVRLPGSHRAAVLASAMLRARLLLRGIEPVPPAALDPEEELRLDALWRGSTSLAHINYALADVLLLRHMRATLDGGSPTRLVQSLTYEAAAEVTLGNRYLDRHASELLAYAERLLAAAHDDYEALVHHLHELAEDARAGHY
ncbi:MAG TPA: AAA family ATPase, partial [Kofleriaceae bacterium]|nr:AAA family ATPase [Kofleriaceae bacterium]